MANKKSLKKNVKQMIYDFMDECDYVVVSGGKGADAANNLMDEIVAYYEEILSKINAAKNKADFGGIRKEIEAKALEFVDKLNGLN